MLQINNSKQEQAKGKKTLANKLKYLEYLGKNKNLFLITCAALVLNIILMFSGTVHAEIERVGGGNYSFIGFSTFMVNALTSIAGHPSAFTDIDLYNIFIILGDVGVILIILSAFKVFWPLIKEEKKRIPLGLIMIAAIYNFALFSAVMQFLNRVYSSPESGGVYPTVLGWLYLFETIVLLLLAFRLSLRLRKADKESD